MSLSTTGLVILLVYVVIVLAFVIAPIVVGSRSDRD